MNTMNATRYAGPLPSPTPYGSERIQTTGVGYSINVPGRPTAKRPAILRW